MLIYLITNKANGKVYVGRTQKTAAARWYLHVKTAKSGSRLVVHQAIRKYGPEAFSIEVLAYANTVEEFEALEKKFISDYQAVNPKFGYNRTTGGNGFSGLHTQESRDKMRVSHRGKVRSKESRKKQGETMRELIRTGLVTSPRGKGTKRTDEQRQKYRLGALRQWADPTKRENTLKGLRKQCS